ncbi:MAG TPA: GNAT family N-acetyltransferase [Arthrobacter sp.]|nr:GNAT family N-acetyltransferase [Arthrobacter sp.]
MDPVPNESVVPLRLRPLQTNDEAVALEAHRELELENFEFLLGFGHDMAWSEYLLRLDEQRQGLDLPVGRVPASFLLAEVGGKIVGRVSIRHELNTFLRRVGGHIGYAVRPQFRCRGYAGAILRQSLQLAAGLGIDQALVTCDDDNAPSARVIERNGGVLEDVVEDPGSSVGKRRYWVPTGTKHRPEGSA